MRKRFVFLLSLLLFSCVVSAQGTVKEWKAIDNSFYSITIPADWVSFPPGEGDGIHPKERDGGPYHLCYLGWVSALNEMGGNAGPMLFIEGARRLDGKPLSIQTIDAEKMRANEPPLSRHAVRTELKGKPGQVRYQVAKETQMISVASGVSWYQCREFVLLQKGGEIVYWLKLIVGEQYYQSHPEFPRVIEKVLDSFVPKGN